MFWFRKPSGLQPDRQEPAERLLHLHHGGADRGRSIRQHHPQGPLKRRRYVTSTKTRAAMTVSMVSVWSENRQRDAGVGDTMLQPGAKT